MYVKRSGEATTRINRFSVFLLVLLSSPPAYPYIRSLYPSFHSCHLTFTEE